VATLVGGNEGTLLRQVGLPLSDKWQSIQLVITAVDPKNWTRC
jgi:hypothetical protein